jgi:prolyl-tRNA synthetase
VSKLLWLEILASAIAPFIGERYVPRRDKGPIGGDLFHEFIILINTSESEVFRDRNLVEMQIPHETIDYSQDLGPLVDCWTGKYAATSEMHDAARFEREVPAERHLSARSIEVGHIYLFGTK